MMYPSHHFLESSVVGSRKGMIQIMKSIEKIVYIEHGVPTDQRGFTTLRTKRSEKNPIFNHVKGCDRAFLSH